MWLEVITDNVRTRACLLARKNLIWDKPLANLKDLWMDPMTLRIQQSPNLSNVYLPVQTSGIRAREGSTPSHSTKEIKMKQELEQKLYNAFPEFFSEKDLPPEKTCLCWGVEHGDGWFQILWDMCEELKELNPEGFRFTQIKEKFGSMRIYTSYVSEPIARILNKAEKRSDKTCEYCGTIENVTQSGSWIKTICQTCRDKRETNREDW